jgi:hypothetical protein
MRIYLGDSLQKLLSTMVLFTALGVFGWVAWTAIDTWSNDPSLEQIQQIREAS